MKKQTEPSMEEILASIRRIITEDGEDYVRPDTSENEHDMSEIPDPKDDFDFGCNDDLFGEPSNSKMSHETRDPPPPIDDNSINIGMFNNLSAPNPTVTKPDEILERVKRLTVHVNGPDKQEEPTMDEILAAIKRIINSESSVPDVTNSVNSEDENVQESKVDTSTSDMSEEERLAAEWAALASNEDDEEDEWCSSVNTRVLNEDEIDSLLGFDHTCEPSNGLYALVNNPHPDYGRLPMMETIFANLAKTMNPIMRRYTNDNVDISLDQISTIRFGDYVNSIPLPAMLALLKPKELDGYGIITMDSAIIYSLIDSMFGGRRGTSAMRIEGRPYTNIEYLLITDYLKEVTIPSINQSFSEVKPVTFEFERLETNPRNVLFTKPSTVCILAKFRIDMEDRGGRFEMLIPMYALESMKELLQKMFFGDTFHNDKKWREHFTETLLETDVDLVVELGKTTIPLSEALNLRVGQTLMLDMLSDMPHDIYVGDQNVGKAFRSEPSTLGKYQIKLDNILEETKNG